MKGAATRKPPRCIVCGVACRLIEAAPDLLAALKAAEIALQAVSDVPLLKSAIRAAIAKAEGQ